MGVASGGFSVEQLDLLLNELERLAQSSAPRINFYSALLERLRFVCSASATAFIVPIDSQQWGVVACSGPSDFSDFLQTWNEWSTKLDTEEGSLVASNDEVLSGALSGQYLAAYSSQLQPKRGAVVVKIPTPPDSATRDELNKLCQAFAELISIRQNADVEELLNSKLPAFQRLLGDLCATTTLEQAATIMVNDLLPVLGADRIALIQRSLLGGDRVTAVSGTVHLVRRSEAVEAIASIGSKVIESGKSVSSFAGESKSALAKSLKPGTERSTDSGPKSHVAPNYIAFPLGRPIEKSAIQSTSALLVEWDDYEGLLKSTSLMNSVIPTLSVIWTEHEQWLRTPALARKLAKSKLRRVLGSRSSSWLKAGGVFLAVALMVIGLTRPIDFRIEMDGVLEPESQRTVYAFQDGVVTQVLVGDSDKVTQGQLLVTMRSPALEIQIQEALGELKANSEKRDALSLNINQLARDGSANPSTLNRLSSEVKQLETVKETLERKLVALRQEEGLLKIVSPIDGVIVARDLHQLLDSRPLRRGEALFRVVNPDGPWRLQLSIADSDAGYVKQQLFGESGTGGGVVPKNANSDISFVLASKPDLQFKADIVWLSDSARNPRGTGVALDAIATIHSDALDHVYVGATAQAFILCGRRPIWFVFSRPLVESIQRKLWF